MSYSYTAEIGNLEPGLDNLGVRVVDLSGTVLTAFSTTGVAETIADVSGAYQKTLTLPDSTVRIEWFIGSDDGSGEFAGYETVTPPVTAGDAPTVEEIVASILATPSHKIAVDAAGNVSVDAGGLADDIAGQIEVSGLTNNQASQLSTIYANVQGGTINVTQRVATGGTIHIYRGERLVVPLSALGDVSDGRQVWFTVKGTPTTDTDDQAIIQIKRNGGLTTFQGAPTGNSADGSIEFDDAATGTGRIVLNEAKTALLTKPDAAYDIQVLDPAAGPVTKAAGKVLLSKDSDVTRAVG